MESAAVARNLRGECIFGLPLGILGKGSSGSSRFAPGAVSWELFQGIDNLYSPID